MVTPALSPTDSLLRDSPLAASVFRSPGSLVRECLAGILTSLALVPEVISFSVVAGVSPQVSLLSSVVMGIVMSLLGGRAAMVTAAAGSVALVIGPTVKAHGAEYAFPIVLLAGVIQIAFGLGGLAKLIRYVPRSVMDGFVNALGVLIFCAQLPHVLGHASAVYWLFALTIVVVQLVPRVAKAIPSPLVAIALVTSVAALAQLDVPRVGADGSLTHGLPGFTRWLVPLNWQTMRIVAPAALSVALVGLLESLLTAKLVDDVTDTQSDKSRESWALGIANILAGCYGGIAGCAMIGQTVVNVEIGRARSRVSTTVAALMLLLFVTSLSHVAAQIPMVALAAVMMVVALKTINWRTLRWTTLKRVPIAESSAMGVTLAVTVCTSNLALGVLAGVLLATALFAHRIAHGIRAERNAGAETVQYDIHGPVFFGNSDSLVQLFAYDSDPARVRVDFSHSQVADAASVAALESIEQRYRARGVVVTFTGLDARSSALQRQLSAESV